MLYFEIIGGNSFRVKVHVHMYFEKTTIIFENHPLQIWHTRIPSNFEWTPTINVYNFM